MKDSYWNEGLLGFGLDGNRGLGNWPSALLLTQPDRLGETGRGSGVGFTPRCWLEMDGFDEFRITFCKFSTMGKVAAVFPMREAFGFLSQAGIVENGPDMGFVVFGGGKGGVGPAGPLFDRCTSGFSRCGAYGSGGGGPLLVQGGFLNGGGSGGGGPFVRRFSLG